MTIRSLDHDLTKWTALMQITKYLTVSLHPSFYTGNVTVVDLKSDVKGNDVGKPKIKSMIHTIMIILTKFPKVVKMTEG